MNLPRSGRASFPWGVKMRYQVVLEESDEGFAVSVPSLPGCNSQGATEQEAIENIADAIREYLAAIRGRLLGANVREVEVNA
jgi:predicted RNase H-like HicB family nuclease